ncbi:MAG: redox-sensing transcriptional repressor Rex [Anaerolineae bacterium]|nr:redox-sensing transcriptional repressor Rex [Anaerolineae bacterium]
MTLAKVGLPRPTLHRLPIYYRRLRQAVDEGTAYLSSADLAQSADVSEAQVRKDFSHLELEGRSGVGYDAKQMAAYLEEFLGLTNDKEAVLVGVGNLGRALALFPGFTRYGLNIVACFDSDPLKVGQTVGECEVLPVARLPDLAQRLHIRMGIITVPAEAAQEVADLMIEGGIRVIWNFAPCRLRVPEGTLVQNEDLAAQLATLSHLIAQRKLSAQTAEKQG